HAVERIPQVLKAPDEITALQWACGVSATGAIPMTATSRPGFSLMVESVDMAFMMELPVLIVIVQRLGPSTGSATTGAQGDVSMLHRMVSGGYNIPTISPSNLKDCYLLSGKALRLSVELRTPVVLLTSKEMVETERSLDLKELPGIEPAEWNLYRGSNYRPYGELENLVPKFMPLGENSNQVRITASTHDQMGLLKKATPESLENTERLSRKIDENISRYNDYQLEENENADTLIVTYGITSYAARDAVGILGSGGIDVSLLIVKTLFPVSEEVIDIINRYRRVIVAEENLTGQYRTVLWGETGDRKVSGVNAIGRMVTPQEIVREVEG
ncbi:MAG: hypothetical protein GF417_02450, partial [Candidatus Latescibacteria bacterium]|nr:hypothetical protein [bacterium]MBD3423289.1 hypothetical protein [Candidatus Latescibacterota bacterium]